MAETAQHSKRGRYRLGPYSKTLDRGAVGQSIDGRSVEGRFLRAYEVMLAEHCGQPSAVQRVLIARASRLALHLELMDDRSLKAGSMSERDSRQYLAWSNSLTRCLRELGIEAAAAKPPSLADYLAGRATAPDTAA